MVDGKVNVFTCARCDLVASLDTEFFMYHDEEQKYIVYLFALKELDDDKFLDSFSSDGSYDIGLPVSQEAIYFCHPHYVFSMDEMARYVKFRDRLFVHKTRNISQKPGS